MITRLRIAAWDETVAAEFDDGSKITRAAVTLAEGTDGVTGGTMQSVMYYRPDGTSDYVNVIRLTAVLDGRTGTFVATGHGGYDGTAAAGTSDIVPGSGIGELAGISGTVTSSSTHADYPFMPLILTYQFA